MIAVRFFKFERAERSVSLVQYLKLSIVRLFKSDRDERSVKLQPLKSSMVKFSRFDRAEKSVSW